MSARCPLRTMKWRGIVDRETVPVEIVYLHYAALPLGGRSTHCTSSVCPLRLLPALTIIHE